MSFMDVARKRLSQWTRRRRARWHDGLSSLRKICKSASYDKRLWIINADHVVVGHVSGSHQLGRVLHEMFTFTVLEHRLLESSAVCCELEMFIKNRVLSF